MLIDFATIDEDTIYSLINHTISPRPIAWISTIDDGVVNLAPFSYFAPISTTPAYVMVAIGQKDTNTPKDTLQNILKHKICTINFVHQQLIDDMLNSADVLEYGISECTKYNIQTIIKDIDFPPIVKETKCALFCQFVKQIELDGEISPLILQIKKGYYSDDSIDKNLTPNINNIGRVGSGFRL